MFDPKSAALLEFTEANGLARDQPRTIYLSSGVTLSGTLTGWSVVVSHGGAFVVSVIKLRLDGGGVVVIPWHAVQIVAGAPIEVQS